MDNVYTKEELKEAERFKNRRDVIEALLKDNVYYSIGEAEEIIEDFTTRLCPVLILTLCRAQMLRAVWATEAFVQWRWN